MTGFDTLTIVYGTIIGISLGLTGGGGSIFAVPLLIYGLHTNVREAVGISLAAVGATALFGALMHLRPGHLEVKTAFVFALAGMAGAPFGTWIGARLPDALTLSVFALLMLFVGYRMWRIRAPRIQTEPTCPRDENDQLHWTSRCFVLLMLSGLLVGVLSGIFGVGGGFIIVPALIMVSGMNIHRAVSSSLLVIALICVSGVASYLIRGDSMPVKLSSLFIIGGLIGMIGGGLLRSRLSASMLRRVFAVGMWLVGLFVLAQNLGFASSPSPATMLKEEVTELNPTPYPWLDTSGKSPENVETDPKRS
tara:strand:+ start:1556 stop:2476 length:921 start_codon:yes stop_codon:yes gene_type:complete